MDKTKAVCQNSNITNERKDNMKDQAINNRRALNHIRNALALGWITYNEAQEMAEPFLKNINEKGEEIAKKYGRKYNKITFIEVMRQKMDYQKRVEKQLDEIISLINEINEKMKGKK